ncbi:MAG: hypothetical protein V4532_16735, partial [Pseudomonadota bacterium]
DDVYDQRDKEADKTKPASGAAVFDRKVFNAHLGKALAEINKLCHEHGLLRAGKPWCAEHKKIRESLEDAEKECKGWSERLAKAKN